MSDCEFDTLRDFLLREENYPEGGPVEFKETHISYVFLTPQFAYKLLKPINFGFLDFSTKEARRRECANELDLNRRLASDVYLDVVPIFENEGSLTFLDDGEPVDWLIKMRRLDESQTLEAKILSRSANEEDIDLLLDVLIPFLQNAETNDDIAKNGDVAVIRKNVSENFGVLESAARNGLVNSAFIESHKSSQLQFLAFHSSLLEQRIEANRVRHVHGDLRAEHIYFDKKYFDKRPAIIDCIAFNERFRCNDILDEICFLAADLEKLRREDLAEYLINSFRERMPDDAPEELVGFFKAYRHTVRAKVDCLRMRSASEDEIIRLRENVARHLEDARCLLDKFHHPLLVVFFGKSGTGKSTVARGLSDEIGAKIVSSDVVRKNIFGLKSTERGKPDTVYTRKANEKTYGRMCELAANALSNKTTVIFDATFQRAADRRHAIDIGKIYGVKILFVECRCADGTLRSRIEKRKKRNTDVSDAGVDVYQKQSLTFEPADEISENILLVLDTTKETQILLEQIIGKLCVL